MQRRPNPLGYATLQPEASYSLPTRAFDRRIAFLLRDYQAIRYLTLGPFARTVPHFPAKPQCGRSATVKVHRFLAAQAHHEPSQLLQGHANGQASLAPIDFNKEESVLIPANGRSWMPFEHRAVLIIFVRAARRFLKAPIVHNDRASTHRGFYSVQSRIRGGKNSKHSPIRHVRNPSQGTGSN